MHRAVLLPVCFFLAFVIVPLDGTALGTHATHFAAKVGRWAKPQR